MKHTMELNDLERNFEGRLTEPMTEPLNFNLRKLLNYCKENNIEPDTLTDEQIYEIAGID